MKITIECATNVGTKIRSLIRGFPAKVSVETTAEENVAESVPTPPQENDGTDTDENQEPSVKGKGNKRKIKNK